MQKNDHKCMFLRHYFKQINEGRILFNFISEMSLLQFISIFSFVQTGELMLASCYFHCKMESK